MQTSDEEANESSERTMSGAAAVTNNRDASAEDSTRTKIMQAALECFMQLGIAKTSLHDVARAADVSRGTVYRYFSERQALIDATIELRAQKYYSDAAEKMDLCETLGAQIGAFGEAVARNVADFQRRRLLEGDSMLMRLSASDRDGALRRMAHFLAPYIEAAKGRGEVRSDVDVTEASEWIARVLMSVPPMPRSEAFDIAKPKTVGKFLESFAVTGLS
jgi:AcrR family transcriptional regulator